MAPSEVGIDRAGPGGCELLAAPAQRGPIWKVEAKNKNDWNC